MENKQSCHLCGLEAGYPPSHKNPLLYGFSCKRCRDYYIDSFLVDLGEPTEDEDRAILSGFTRWENELGRPTPEITNENYEGIISNNKNYSDEEKIDKLLLFYSKKYPDKGTSANYDFNLDYPVTYSKNSDEFIYLLQKVADESLRLIKVMARGVFQILPEGWKRVDWLNKVELADERFNLENGKINSKIEKEIMNLKEKSHLTGSRYSSGLARKIRDIFLEGSKIKIEKKLEIDKKVIFGLEVVSKTDDINFLSKRIKDLAEFEKKFLIKNINNAYENCRAQSYFETDKENFLSEIDNKTRELLIDLQAESIKRFNQRIEEKKGEKMLQEKKTVLDDSKKANPKKVFVVHGRNENARKAIFAFLRSIDLQPIEWGEARRATGKATPYTGEILDNAFNIAQAVIVLFTGDDIARLREEFVKNDDPAYEKILTPQARTNVIFEAGLAFGTHPDRTILVQLANEKTRPFSDIYGRHFLKLSNSPESRFELISRLETAKCEVNYRGRKDWMTTGDFEGVIDSYLAQDELPEVKLPKEENELELEEGQLFILALIVESDEESVNVLFESYRKQFPKANLVEVKYIANLLEKNGLINCTGNIGGSLLYVATDKGIERVMKESDIIKKYRKAVEEHKEISKKASQF